MTSRTPLPALFAAVLTLGAPALALSVLPTAAHAQAQRDADAENFVGNEASQALTILNQKTPLAQKKAQFRTFVDQVADVPRITHFVLGKYNRTITPQQYDAFAQAFRTYATSVYETRLGQYHGEKLRVTGSIVRAPGDVIVTSQVVGGEVKTPTEVKWRVIRGGDGHYRAVDVSVEGVWLAITEQQDFVSTLDNNHGDINVLIRQLRTQTDEELKQRS
jgi:phospholipid transport system substrate-binding protein